MAAEMSLWDAVAKAGMHSDHEGHIRHCQHEHKIHGTGAVFFQSLGILQCCHCRGFQLIKKPLS